MKLTPAAKTTLTTALLTSVFTIVLLLLVNYYFNHSFNLFAGSSKANPFTAQGTGSATAQPDEAQISFTVSKTAPLLTDAQKQANTSTNTIVEHVQNAGIAKKDIKTTYYNSSPNYSSDTTPQVGIMMPIRPQQSTTIISYTVTENVEIDITDNAKVNAVIDSLTKDEAENVSGPNFIFSDTTQKSLQQKARRNAIADAKQKANDLANAAGLHLGRLVNIQENNNNVVPIMMKGAPAQTGTGSTGTNINPGENTITDTVTLTYETW